MEIGTVLELWRYPVKSMRGERLESAEVGARGIHGDRAYALIDHASGHVASAKRPRLWGRLLDCRAEMLPAPCPEDQPGAVDITLPDGRTVRAGEAEADEALTDLLGRAVHLTAQAPDQATIERYWPSVAGLARRGGVTANEIGQGAPPGTFFDYAPLHLLTTASLAYLRQLYPGGDVTASRFRPNLLIAPTENVAGFAENGWVGHALTIGETVRLRITDPTPRCIVPTLPQAGGPRDTGILRAIAWHNRPPVPALGGATLPSLGVYAIVEQSGAIRRGDQVRWAPEP